MRRLLKRIGAGWGEHAVRAGSARPARVLLLCGLVALVCAGIALAVLRPSAATDTLVGSRSDAYQATERYRERFGDHSVIILVRGDLPRIVLTKNLGLLLGLEGCIAGNKPSGVEPPGGPKGPCARFAELKPAQVVYGPGTFINAAVGEIQEQFRGQLADKAAQAKRASDAARKLAKAQGASKAEQDRLAKSAESLVYGEFTRDLLSLALKYGLSLNKLPQINDPDFVSQLVFDPSQGATTPKARFAYLFPNSKSAIIQVRFKPDLSEEDRAKAIALVRAAVKMPEWKLDAATYVVTGAPVVVEDLTVALSDSLLRLLVVALLVMAIVLSLVFRVPRRLLPLLVALAAVAITFGVGLLFDLGDWNPLFDMELTMATIAVLPVLLGLGVDYGIQWQARVQADGLEGALKSALPMIRTAMIATVAGFAALLLSPVPMVRSFGWLLIIGVQLALALAFLAGTAGLMWRRDREPGDGFVARSLRGAEEVVASVGRRFAFVGRRARRLGGWVLGLGVRRPGRVLLVGFVLAVAGWALDSQTEVVSDIRDLVPQDLPAVRDLTILQEDTGVSGEIDVVVEAEDLTDPAVVKWMRDYQSKLLKRFKYSRANGCGEAELCPALSLPDLFRTEAAASDRAKIRALLDAVPPYFSQAVITNDRRTATLAFGIRLMPLERQKQVLEVMRDELKPPKGVKATLAGLPVLAADANAALSAPVRRFATLIAGLLLVGLALWLVYRSRRRAWVPLVPIALATGWSALVLFILGVPLNPMSATLGALVIAISTEFAVLLSARFRDEREGGLDVGDALRRTYSSTGAAVLASGATALAGFAVLALSDVQMLRDFGIVTVIDLGVSLLGVLAVLPAALVWAERRA